MQKPLWSNEVLDGCSKNPVVLKTKEWVSTSFKSTNLLTHFLTQRHWPPAEPLFILAYPGCLLSSINISVGVWGRYSSVSLSMIFWKYFPSSGEIHFWDVSPCLKALMEEISFPACDLGPEDGIWLMILTLIGRLSFPLFARRIGIHRFIVLDFACYAYVNWPLKLDG